MTSQYNAWNFLLVTKKIISTGLQLGNLYKDEFQPYSQFYLVKIFLHHKISKDFLPDLQSRLQITFILLSNMQKIKTLFGQMHSDLHNQIRCSTMQRIILFLHFYNFQQNLFYIRCLLLIQSSCIYFECSLYLPKGQIKQQIIESQNHSG